MIDVSEERNQYLDELIQMAQDSLEEIEDEASEIKRKIAKSQVLIEIAKLKKMPYEEENARLLLYENEFEKFCEKNGDKEKELQQNIEMFRGLKV